MERYKEYKDSGIEWIGQIPSHWELLPLKNICKSEKYSIKTGPFGSQLKGEDLKEEGEIRVYNQKNVITQDFTNSEFYISQKKAQELDSFTTLPNDILITSRGTIGKATILNPNYIMGILHPCLIALRIDERKANLTWVCRWINDSESFKKEIESKSNATTIDVIYTDTIKNIKIIVPPLSEQKEIADYLDKKCGEIDAAVVKVDKELELLDELKQSEISKAVTKGLNPDVSFKPSGIDWIGEIPSHWKISRLKNYVDIFGRIGFRGYTNEDLVNEGEGAITLSPSNIIDGKINYSKCSYLSWNKYYESPEIMINEGDVIFVKTASVGKSALISHLPMETTLNPQIVVFKNIKIINKFLDYILKTPLIIHQVNLSVGGSTILTITQDSIGNYKLPIPPISEQKEIADYLDRKCGEIDSLKEKLKQKKEKLQELRQSLISEVVTGKRKVI